MDSAHVRRTSSPPQLPSISFSTRESRSVNSNIAFEQRSLDPDISPSRQQRLLSHRNARFPAKKLSISGLSNKLSQLISNNDPSDTDTPPRDQENSKLHKSKSTGTIGKRSSLGILEEVSNTAKNRSQRRRGDIPIYQDNPEVPLFQSSPFTSSPFIDPRGDFTSPIAFDQIHDNLAEMQVKQFSFNDTWSSNNNVAPIAKSRKRSVPTHFDADQYIEHIEKELQQTRDEAYSPLTRRPMKEKLRAANKENERLQKELAQVREKFETEVKRTVEHKTVTELELKRKVRDLEESLEEKEHTIRELQYQYEEKRLESNIINSLKANIERLEQEKSDMEEINLGMSKRNEVLTQLLAMSPTKIGEPLHLGSPVREKRQARPISLILPRQASPVDGVNYAQPNSVVCSPRALNSADISPFKLSPDFGTMKILPGPQSRSLTTPQDEFPDPLVKLRSPIHERTSRRSTMYSDISASSSGAHGGAVFANDERLPPRRKARRFIGGSTQLKPLLLPTLTGESFSMPSTSTASSPRSWPLHTQSDVDVDDTILPSDEPAYLAGDELDLSIDAEQVPVLEDEGKPGPVFSSEREIDQDEDYHACELELSVVPRDESCEPSSPPMQPSLASLEAAKEHEPHEKTPYVAELSTEHLKQHNSRYSMQVMPMPSTPESLVSLPQPLFSPRRNIGTPEGYENRTKSQSGSPNLVSTDYWQVNVGRKRKHSLGRLDSPSPIHKAHRQCQPAELNLQDTGTFPTLRAPPDSIVASSTTSAKNQLQKIRSSDNFADLLRQKNFAARPLAAMTIRAVYTLLSTCTSAVRQFRHDPFSLARRVLANAWRMNWKMFGKVSWWVLGLFIEPQARPKARAPIDWDQYDGESIASKYCSSTSDHEESDSDSLASEDKVPSGQAPNKSCDSYHESTTVPEEKRPGWGHSIYLWGKFSAALALAVGGAVVKGPGEMLAELNSGDRKKRRHKSCKSCTELRHEKRETQGLIQGTDPSDQIRCIKEAAQSHFYEESIQQQSASFDFRFELDSTSLLEHIQEGEENSTLRPEGSKRGRLGSLFSPTPSSVELASRMQNLRLSSSSFDSSTPISHDTYPSTLEHG